MKQLRALLTFTLLILVFTPQAGMASVQPKQIIIQTKQQNLILQTKSEKAPLLFPIDRTKKKKKIKKAQQHNDRYKTLGTLSVVFSAVGLVFFVLLSVAGLILGALSYREHKLGLIGLILGMVGVILWVAILAILLVVTL